jgi:hypothetical protein
MTKFDSQRAAYRSRRAELGTALGDRDVWSVADHWPLYAGTTNLARYFAIESLLRSTLHVPGHVAEFGVWRGANTMFMAKTLQILDHYGPKEVHAFDSFEGLTQFSEADPHDTGAGQFRGQYKGSLDELRAMLALEDLQDAVDIHVGYIEDTLPAFLQQRPEVGFSFVYCDTDLYASTRTILDNLHDRLSPGGLFVFDEWNLEEHAGEGVAANEFIAEYRYDYTVEAVPHTRQPSLALRKR